MAWPQASDILVLRLQAREIRLAVFQSVFAAPWTLSFCPCLIGLLGSKLCCLQNLSFLTSHEMEFLDLDISSSGNMSEFLLSGLAIKKKVFINSKSRIQRYLCNEIPLPGAIQACGHSELKS